MRRPAWSVVGVVVSGVKAAEERADLGLGRVQV